MSRSFVLARVNIMGSFEDKYAEVVDLLIGSGPTYSHGYKYSIVDIAVRSLADKLGVSRKFVFGKVVRHRDEIEHVVEQKSSTPMMVDDEISGEAAFCFSVEHSIVAYSLKNMRDSVFRTNFANIIEESRDGFMIGVYVDPILETAEFIENIGRMSEVKKISLVLRPSNPNYRERWKHVDEELRNQNISSQVSWYWPQKGDHINILEDSNVMDSLYMAADGYGKASVSGKLDGSYTVLKSIEAAKEIEVSSDFEPESEAEQILLGQKIVDVQTEMEADDG